MIISCETCKTIFKANEKYLNSKGIVVTCPNCKHPHFAKRVVLPYKDGVIPNEFSKEVPTSKMNLKNINKAEIQIGIAVQTNKSSNVKLDIKEETMPDIGEILTTDYKQFETYKTYPQIKNLDTDESSYNIMQQSQYNDSLKKPKLNIYKILLYFLLGALIGGFLVLYVLNIKIAF